MQNQDDFMADSNRIRPVSVRRDRAAAGGAEAMWAWLSLLTLVLCWDAAARLDERVSPPRVRIAHAVERESALDQRTRAVKRRRRGAIGPHRTQNALMPVSARPTVS